MITVTNVAKNTTHEVAEVKDVPCQNLLINGDFQCNQRELSDYPFGKYGIDMWFVNGNKYFWSTDGLVFDNIWQKIPLLKGTNYVLSYKINKTNVQKNIIIKSLNTEYTDGYLKVKLETDDVYTKVRLIKNDLTNPDRINYVQLTEGNTIYPHVKEDYGLATTRCLRFVEKIHVHGYIYGLKSNSVYWLNAPLNYRVTKAGNCSCVCSGYDMPNVGGNINVWINGTPAHGISYSVNIDLKGKTVDFTRYITTPVRFWLTASCEPL